MAERNFLVLGGGRYQLPYIKAARALGCRTLCFDMYPDPPGKKAADVFIQCDTSDRDRAVELAREHNVVGVIAPATDIAVLTKAAIDEALGFRGPSVPAARILTDKTAFREWRDACGRAGPLWARIDTRQPPESLPLPPPCIVKPNQSSGGRGARKINALGEYQELWSTWDTKTRQGGALAEAWIDGNELSFEGFLRDGQFWFAAVTTRLTARPPFVATTGHLWPADIAVEAVSEVVDCVEQTCRELGITDGPVDADLIYTDRPDLLELSPRPGGNCLAQLVETIYGLDYVQLVVRSALGERPGGNSPEPIESAAAIWILNSPVPGRLAYSQRDHAAGKPLEGVKWLELDYKPGSRVPAFHSGRDRLGAIIATGATTAEAGSTIARQLRELDWRIESGAST